ncbi:MAG: hypothetical protein US51_C0034G0006 [Microgenomates group bacterium GW2011_GWA2_37_6]|nr:MAG: hypothetical protein US51_C0034G0006 [Microgenomates group bacterium GW2011_GWA2_37_6]
MKKEIEQDFEWDRKRILIGLGILSVIAIAAFELKGLFLNKNGNVLGETNINKSSEIEKPNVKPPNINLQSEIDSTIANIKKNIGQLDTREVASSSPQIQKVLQDIQGIKDLPSSQAKEMCLKICSGI